MSVLTVILVWYGRKQVRYMKNEKEGETEPLRLWTRTSSSRARRKKMALSPRDWIWGMVWMRHRKRDLFIQKQSKREASKSTAGPISGEGRFTSFHPSILHSLSSLNQIKDMLSLKYGNCHATSYRCLSITSRGWVREPHAPQKSRLSPRATYPQPPPAPS